MRRLPAANGDGHVRTHVRMHARTHARTNKIATHYLLYSRGREREGGREGGRERRVVNYRPVDTVRPNHGKNHGSYIPDSQVPVGALDC